MPSATPGAFWAWATFWRWWSRSPSGVDMEAAQKLAAKVKSGAGFDLNDFLGQIQQMKQMGGLSSLMDKLPAAMAAKAGQVDMDRAEKDIKRKEGIIHSMTPLERRKPDLIKATRKRRIAAGAGVQVQEVNRMLKEFEQMQDMMKKMKGGGMMKMMKRMGGMKGMPKMPFLRDVLAGQTAARPSSGRAPSSTRSTRHAASSCASR
jgi:signal recognition particle subunit SRP54